MKRISNLLVLFFLGFALLTAAALFLLAETDSITSKDTKPTTSSVRLEQTQGVVSPSLATTVTKSAFSNATGDQVPPQKISITETPITESSQLEPSAEGESQTIRSERRRLAREILEEFRNPSKAAPDWETTTHPGLFLPNGKPVDPYMLPPLQLPAAMTIENHSIEITTDLQVSEWERLQDEFIADVRGVLPTDASSRKIWIKAQRKNDDKFRAKFGTEAFQRQQMDAYRAGVQQM
jgi:hypothetical protein